MPNPLLSRLRAFWSKPVFRRPVIGLGIAVLLYGFAGYVVLPIVLKSQLAKIVEENFQRTLSIGKVSANPFALTLTMRDFKIMEPKGDVIFAAFDTLRLNLSTESLLRLAPVVQEARLTKPYVLIERTGAHSYNIDDIVDAIANRPPSDKPARYSINNIQVDEGRIEFQDRPGGALHVVAGLKLGVPFISSLPSDVTVFVEPLLSAQVNGTPVHIAGKARPFADPKDVVVEFNFDGMDLTSYLAYLPLEPGFKVRDARLDMHLTASFQQFKETPPALIINGSAGLKSLKLIGRDGRPVLQVPELAVTLRDIRPFGGAIDVARVAINGVTAELHRDRDGSLNLPGLRPSNRPPSASAKEPSALRFSLGELQIRDANVRFRDDRPPKPIRAGAEKLDLVLRDVTVDTGNRTAAIATLSSSNAAISFSQDKSAGAVPEPVKQVAQTPSPAYTLKVGQVDIANWSARLEDLGQPQAAAMTIAPLRLSLREVSTAASSKSSVDLKATVNKTGQLSLSGSLGLAPLHTDLAVEMNNVDLLPLQPYIADRINLRFTRAGLSSKGRLQFEQAADGTLQGGFKGDLSVDNASSVDKSTADELLRWKSLAVRGMDLRLQPFAVAVEDVALTDFFTRLILDASGRINLQDIVRGPARPQKTGARIDASPAPMPPVTIRRFTLQGGRVRFTDNFIRPNYSASLTSLGGTVTGLSSDPASSAGVDLRGEVNRAPLSVAGRINPLRKDLFLDLKASVRGMEMVPLSAYSDRYIGYGIEKGKLSFDIAYRVEDRKLTAENRLILDQLTFGSPSERPNATRLPVQFAMALLRDRNGVVDINVPIGGSLDDPQFSIGGIILKVIGNAIMKAVTQPFALLGSIFGGGGEQLSSLEFDAGRALIPAGREDKLRTLARALADRPALRLEIAGRARPETDLPGLKRASIDRKVRALKLKDLTARGEDVVASSVVVGAEEYPALLNRVYKDEKFAKPRNLLGMQKELPVGEMEQLMIANTAVDEDDLAALANRRAQAVKDWLTRAGQINGERIFVLAPRVGGQDAAEKVDFALR
jgi:hypothetical protein